jgi:SAM-dependent methyltransferase
MPSRRFSTKSAKPKLSKRDKSAVRRTAAADRRLPVARRAKVAADARTDEANRAILEELRRLREENEELLRRSNRQEQPPAPAAPSAAVEAKALPEDVLSERQEFAENLALPGRDAPVFNLVNDFLTIGSTPWADPLVPAYLLDKNYRIVDWNHAFGMAFDHTMDGRRGLSVLEWVYFLDNYEVVLKNAEAAFADETRLPRLHVEPIEYRSQRYNTKVAATKRAYQIPAEDETVLGWLVTLEVRFDDPSIMRRYKRDLFETLRHDLTWSEYALSYDRVLTSSKVYLDLIDHIIGEAVPRGGMGELKPMRSGSRVLDLGAGSGNAALRLAKQGRQHLIFAVENNRPMLDLLRDKCQALLRSDDKAPGILAIKQDINTLFGLPENSFDYAILNNVAYTLEDPLPCLRQVHKRLKADGEIRVSGPQKSTDLERLFARMAADLKSAGKMVEVREDFDRVCDINRNILSENLYRWTVDDVKQMLRTAGFGEITYATDAAYAGQSMIVCAKKSSGGRRDGR